MKKKRVFYWPLRKSLVWEGTHTLKQEWGRPIIIVFHFKLTLSSLGHGKIAPVILLSRSCQTPRVIHPSVMRTTAVVFTPTLPLSRLCQTSMVINPSVIRTTAMLLCNSAISGDATASTSQVKVCMLNAFVARIPKSFDQLSWHLIQMIKTVFTRRQSEYFEF